MNLSSMIKRKKDNSQLNEAQTESKTMEYLLILNQIETSKKNTNRSLA